MKIALFGGAFDPPHVGHQMVAKSLIKQNIVDQVWFVPVFHHPWANRYNKQKLTSYDDRVAMLELMIDDWRVDSEIIHGKKTKSQQSNLDQIKIAHFYDVSFTYDTLIYFSQKYPQHTFSWVMGSEYLNRFDDFLRGHPKLLDFQFYIYPRAGYLLKPDLKKENMIFLNKMTEVLASSTDIKKLIADRQLVHEMLVEKVENFIIQNKLYL